MEKWIELASTLVSGGVGIVAVVISVGALKASRRQVEIGQRQIDQTRKHEEGRRRGRENAMRAALHAVLSNLCAWSEGVAIDLAELPVRRPIPMTARKAFVLPSVPTGEIDALVRMIEATDDEDLIRRLSRLISNIQVLCSRTTMISMRRKAISLMPENIDVFLLDAAIVHAQATSVFAYARRTRDTVPPTVTWDDVKSSMTALGMYGGRYDGVVRTIDQRRESGRGPEHANERE